MVNEFIIRRTFDAPLELLWDAFTQTKHLKNWLGPKGAKVGHSKMDFRPNGIYHYCMISPDGQEMWGKMVYREIDSQKKIVFVNSFSDKNGNITRHPLSKAWPLEMLSTYSFSESDDKTTVAIRWIPINASPVEIKTFDDGREGMKQGWTGSLDMLEAYLKEIQNKNKRQQKITPFLWFDDQAEAAVDFYVSIFENSKIKGIAHYDDEGAKASGRKKGSVMTVGFQLRGQDFTAINGGPIFKFSPSISLFAYCKDKKEIDEIYKKLSENGEVMMNLGKYPFSERYAFLKDRFGLAWQLMLSQEKHIISPSLLFVGKDLGKAQDALNFYTKVFKDAKIDHILHYEKGENGLAGTVKHSSFILYGQEFIAMDGTGPHMFSFNESISFVVNCGTQEEIDYYWEKLSSGGEESQCGWLKDRFGISWQVVPTILSKIMVGGDQKMSKMAMAAILKMKKIEIKKIIEAAG